MSSLFKRGSRVRYKKLSKELWISEKIFLDERGRLLTVTIYLTEKRATIGSTNEVHPIYELTESTIFKLKKEIKNHLKKLGVNFLDEIRKGEKNEN